MDGFAVTVVFKAKNGNVESMLNLIADVYLPSIRESGMREYRWYQSEEQPSEFLLFMTWDSRQAFDDHVNSAHIQKIEADFLAQDILVEPAPENYWHYLKP